MTFSSSVFFRRSHKAAFSMVEVALALGVVSFGLIGVLGALPLAVSSSRASIDQSRATSLANCLYASFRSQKFDRICFVNEQFDTDGVTPLAGAVPTPINLFTENTPAGSTSATFYASIVDTPADATTNDPRRVNYSSRRQPNSTYQIVMRFQDQPDGLQIPGVANRVELTINPINHPSDVYRFSSIIANRSGSAYGAITSS